VPICASCGQDNPDIAKFCLSCGAPLALPPPTSEERKLITVLFTDIVGSTAKAEQMDPEDVRARLAPYYARLRGELERYGGTVEKFIGDAVVALFGAPVAHEDDPERAVRAAFSVCNAIDELNAEDEWLDLQVRVGVNTGEALVVVGARATEGEGMAAGDVMNTAARLQSAAPVNGVLVGELTYAATRGSIEYREAEPIAAKGKSEPVRVWEAVTVKEVEPTAAAASSDLIGREDEVAALEDVWQTALDALRPVVATVVGPPGVGKSRLLAEFMRHAARTGRVHRGRCLSYGEGITYWPITEIFKSAAEILQSDDREAVASKLGEFLETLATDDLDELRTIAAALSNLIGIPTTPRGTYVTSEISQSELHWGIRRALQLLAAERPLAIGQVGIPLERRSAREQLEEHAGERVDISPPVHLPALNLFRRDVVDRAGEHSFAAQAVHRRRVLREAEIGQEGAIAVLHEDVPRFYVAVDEALGVGCVEGLGDRHENSERTFDVEAALALEHVAEVAAPHVSHR
jgi:class 3 adenylate cyclase